MGTKTAERAAPAIGLPVIDRDFIDQTFERVTGAELIPGNDVRLLVDATENYPAWLDAIGSATHRIFFESYIIHGDDQGDLFADALIAKANEGVEVKVIYDWMGGFGKTPGSFWRRLRSNGIEVRCYNPPNFFDPLGIFSRDHRKTIIVDGRTAFITGLCVGRDWVGDPEKGVPPWRDTGVQLTGPAVAEVEAAFAEVWAAMGPPLDAKALSHREDLRDAGPISLRVVRAQRTRRRPHLPIGPAPRRRRPRDDVDIGCLLRRRSLIPGIAERRRPGRRRRANPRSPVNRYRSDPRYDPVDLSPAA